MISHLTSVNENFSFLHASSQIEADVIFVHGLRGGPFMTWRQQEEKTSADKNGTECWPKVLVWSISNEVFSSIGFKRMSLVEFVLH